MLNNLISLLAVIVIALLIAAVAVRALGGNLALVEDWKKAWKWYSSYALAFIGLLPDLYNNLVTSGIANSGDIPPLFNYTLKAAVVLAFLVHKVNQARPIDRPDWDNDGNPG